MKKKNPAFDAYIAKAQPFARPILTKIRDLFHRACPEIEEVMKWSHPSFACQGIVAGMAAFKEHMRFGFWKESLLKHPDRIFKSAQRHQEFGLRSLDDLAADDVIIARIREAVQLNKAGVKPARPRNKMPRPSLEPPAYFLAALRQKKGALAKFEAFSPSARREYVEWLLEAKREATRAKRLATAVDWIAEGKPRNWKYLSGCVAR